MAGQTIMVIFKHNCFYKASVHYVLSIYCYLLLSSFIDIRLHCQWRNQSITYTIPFCVDYCSTISSLSIVREDVLEGKLQWDDQSRGSDKRYKGFLILTHPSMPQVGSKTHSDAVHWLTIPLLLSCGTNWHLKGPKHSSSIQLGVNVEWSYLKLFASVYFLQPLTTVDWSLTYLWNR